MHYIFTTSASFTKATAKKIEKRIKAIDGSASLVGPLRIPGNKTTGWIERPNDGCNDYGHVARRNEKIADIAREEIEAEA